MLLRIEDTDRERSTTEAVAAIIGGLTWLGLDWHGDAVSQYSRAERHREIARKLLAAGRAYYCYCTPQELESMRARAAAEPWPFSAQVSPAQAWRDLPAAARVYLKR